ncbi:hypothetical protein E2C01_000912 [Portunus trituberculatus]|uniref:Uncharacterized protein n=1 Tax=Portunus trituberculatus TaxID=210409 RepID=A0A5B7CHX1_PORTR|nr:hypothetical protein [Portunus trituberculatus]
MAGGKHLPEDDRVAVHVTLSGHVSLCQQLRCHPGRRASTFLGGCSDDADSGESGDSGGSHSVLWTKLCSVPPDRYSSTMKGRAVVVHTPISSTTRGWCSCCRRAASDRK